MKEDTQLELRCVDNGNLAVVFHQHSIYNGDITFLTFSIDTPQGDRREVGRLWGTGGVLSFEGDMEESASIFFDKVVRAHGSYKEELLRDLESTINKNRN